MPPHIGTVPLRATEAASRDHIDDFLEEHPTMQVKARLLHQDREEDEE